MFPQTSAEHVRLAQGFSVLLHQYATVRASNLPSSLPMLLYRFVSFPISSFVLFYPFRASVHFRVKTSQIEHPPSQNHQNSKCLLCVIPIVLERDNASDS